MKFFIPLLILLLVGCGSKPKTEHTEHHDETPRIETPAPVLREVKKVELGLWKEFGVSGSIHRADVKPGTVYGGEGGLVAFKTLNGSVWYGNFEPHDNKPPLETRQVYLVRISGSLANGCGYAIRDYTTAPAQCVMEEKVVGWREARGFLEPRTPNEKLFWKEIENFLRSREWK